MLRLVMLSALAVVALAASPMVLPHDSNASTDEALVELELLSGSFGAAGVVQTVPDDKHTAVEPHPPSAHTTTGGTGGTVDFLSTAAAVLVATLLAMAAAAMVSSSSRRAAMQKAYAATTEYWKCLWYFWSEAGPYAECPYFAGCTEARVHVRSLALINKLWAQPHYRNGTFGDDMRKNLRNVAVPGTGLPLSALCISATLFKLVLLFVYPAVCMAAAVLHRKAEAGMEAVAAGYAEHLLTPTDWFSLWRLNCRVASYHSLVTADKGYDSEDKWTFITAALAKGIPVSPIMELPSIVCKDRNEEGGMGIHFFTNALAGGDWIIQKALHNSQFLCTMLPEGAPLSTIRIVTASRNSFAPDHPEPITPLSGVFRAGRAGALTDHDAILFDLDLNTGVIGSGSVNKGWYQLGLSKCTALLPRTSPEHTASFTAHPDCGAEVTGRVVPDIETIKALVIDAHAKSCPNVPLCGWDVALTTEGICLLEVNLSCNFFQGTVDFPSYFDFVDAQFKHLDTL